MREYQVLDALEPRSAAVRHDEPDTTARQPGEDGEREMPAHPVDARKQHPGDRLFVEHARLREEPPHGCSQVKLQPRIAQSVPARGHGLLQPGIPGDDRPIRDLAADEIAKYRQLAVETDRQCV